jgi:hypothetical protein
MKEFTKQERLGFIGATTYHYAFETSNCVDSESAVKFDVKIDDIQFKTHVVKVDDTVVGINICREIKNNDGLSSVDSASYKFDFSADTAMERARRVVEDVVYQCNKYCQELKAEQTKTNSIKAALAEQMERHVKDKTTFDSDEFLDQMESAMKTVLAKHNVDAKVNGFRLGSDQAIVSAAVGDQIVARIIFDLESTRHNCRITSATVSTRPAGANP